MSLPQAIREEIERVNLEVGQAERDYDLNRAAGKSCGYLYACALPNADLLPKCISLFAFGSAGHLIVGLGQETLGPSNWSLSLNSMPSIFYSQS